MSLPSSGDPGPFSSGYSVLQSDLLTLGKAGAAAELAAFMKKHAVSSVDAAFPHAFGHSEDRLLHFAVYFNNVSLVRHLVEECQCDTAQVTR